MPIGHDCVYAASLIILKIVLFCCPSYIKLSSLPMLLK